jgi:hypothetical protein
VEKGEKHFWDQVLLFAISIFFSYNCIIDEPLIWQKARPDPI